MSETARKATLIAAKNEHDAARTGFVRLGTVLVCIRRMSAQSDHEISALAQLGHEIALEFADESRSASDEYQRLIEQEESRHA